MTVALFVKTYTKLISNLPAYNTPDHIANSYISRFDTIARAQEESKAPMSGDEQILLQEITRLLVNISLRKGKDEQVVKVFKTLIEGYTAKYSDFVYTFLGHFYSAIKKAKIS